MPVQLEDLEERDFFARGVYQPVSLGSAVSGVYRLSWVAGVAARLQRLLVQVAVSPVIEYNWAPAIVDLELPECIVTPPEDTACVFGGACGRVGCCLCGIDPLTIEETGVEIGGDRKHVRYDGHPFGLVSGEQVDRREALVYESELPC